jgi:hypothetical protein
LKKIIFSIVLILLQESLFLYSQVKEPEQPYVEEINESIDLMNFNYRVRVSIQGRAGFTEGNLVLNSDVLNYPDRRQVKVKEISKITVLMWEKRAKLNQNMFYPSRYEIFYRDYRKEVLNGNIESLNKIIVINNKRGGVYFYYYDYYKNGRWTVSGVTDFDGFSLKPADGCGISIELMQ